ncbi:hypothetical protein [Flavobacterium sp.]|jgi:hypothetical protein|uniref:hypothetical protein n=1 Tax=Flavobacterium sp. TaxID=239 RepID=UPI0037BEE688
MENRHQVHNLIILDESGSMEEIKRSIITGFNELLGSIKEIETKFSDQEHFISMVSFNSNKINPLHFVEPCSKINKLNTENYNPDVLTPLHDAIGYSINKLSEYLKDKANYSVLVTILTDGEENASIAYDAISIKKLVEKYKNNNWTFTYIGTNHDITKAANDLDIFNVLNFSSDSEGIVKMFEHEKISRVKYSLDITHGIETSDFYKKTIFKLQ